MKPNQWIQTAACVVCAAGLAHADAPAIDVRHIVDRPGLIMEEVTGVDLPEAAHLLLLSLEELEMADLDPEVKQERIAELVACAVHALLEASPDVMREVSPNVREERLATVTAAAVIASREYAQPILDSMLSGRVHPQERQAIENAAAAPDRHLSRTELRSALRCMPSVRPLPVRPEPIRPLPEDPDRVESAAAAVAAPAPAPALFYAGQ